MAQEFAKAFYDSKAWRSCRQSFIDMRTKIDGGMCQRCHKNLGFILHHKIRLTQQNINNALISLNHENLELLCLDCHNEEHKSELFGQHKGNVKPRRASCLFDSDGQPIAGTRLEPQ